MLAKGQGHRHILMCFITGRDHILQIHIRGIAALLFQGKEGLEITLLEGSHLQGHPGILLIKMDGAHHRPVAVALPQGRNGSEKILFVNLAQHVLAEIGADGFYFVGNGGVFIRQICVAGPTVDDAQGVTAFGKVEADRCDNRGILPFKIHSHQTAHGAGHLVHKAAGLAKEDVFRVLAYLGDLLGADLCVKQVVDNSANEHLKSSRGTES